MLRVIEYETIRGVGRRGMRVLSERLVRRTVRAAVRFDRATGPSAERRHCRQRTSEQSERICGIVARALS